MYPGPENNTAACYHGPMKLEVVKSCVVSEDFRCIDVLCKKPTALVSTVTICVTKTMARERKVPRSLKPQILMPTCITKKMVIQSKNVITSLLHVLLTS